ncbi:hypothetical protein RIF29_30447 [Crotalaria pallida]|uniref:Uncharacterized protein n=1 Tax=Crotalaria pallida TaxID=3830 RepID=A0AAN9ELC8_CROPI
MKSINVIKSRKEQKLAMQNPKVMSYFWIIEELMNDPDPLGPKLYPMKKKITTPTHTHRVPEFPTHPHPTITSQMKITMMEGRLSLGKHDRTKLAMQNPKVMSYFWIIEELMNDPDPLGPKLYPVKKKITTPTHTHRVPELPTHPHPTITSEMKITMMEGRLLAINIQGSNTSVVVNFTSSLRSLGKHDRLSQGKNKACNAESEGDVISSSAQVVSGEEEDHHTNPHPQSDEDNNDRRQTVGLWGNMIDVIELLDGVCCERSKGSFRQSFRKQMRFKVEARSEAEIIRFRAPVSSVRLLKGTDIGVDESSAGVTRNLISQFDSASNVCVTNNDDASKDE